jgi:hypothetical protein
MEFEQIRDSVGNALSQALAAEAEMVTRWVAIVEVMDADGERAAYAMAPEGAKPWDSLGLLTFGIQIEQAASFDGDDD